VAVPTELARATPQALQHRHRADEQPRALPWERLRTLTAHIEPAWAGAEVTLAFAFGTDRSGSERAPLEHGQVIEVFGGFPATRALIKAAQERAPQALIGPLAQLLAALPIPADGDEASLRRKMKDYAFAGDAALALGRLHLYQGRLLPADNDLQRAVARLRLDSAAWRWLGLTRLLAGDSAGAPEAFERLMQLGATGPDVRYLHGLSVYRLRRFQAAAEEFGHAMRSGPVDGAARDLLACSLVQQWRVAEALGQLDMLAADRCEGWRLMAQKCRMCANGHRAYQQRMASDLRFRWRERWRAVLGRLAVGFGIIWQATGLLWRRYPWVLLILVPAVVLGLYFFDRAGGVRSARDRLSDAQGQAPNMPCWYVSLVRRRRRAFRSHRFLPERIEQLFKAER